MSGMMDCCGMSDIGRQRSANEDQFMISDVCKSMRVHRTSLTLDHQTRLFGDSQGKLLLVADGMGGHEAGERASQVVIDAFVDYVLNRLSWFMFESCETDESFEQQLKDALISCQKRINREVEAIPQRRGMGSTLTLGYIVWPRMFLVHVGDSRCYLFRNGQLQQLTRDHTLANLATEAQRKLDPDKAFVDEEDCSDGEEPPMANILWNAIGGDGDDPHPDASAIELELGDTLLFCTDGLTKHVSKQKLKELLSQQLGAEQLCQRLVSEANAGGGSDNITVVVSRFLEQQTDTRATEEIELPIPKSIADTVDFETPSAELLERAGGEDA